MVFGLFGANGANQRLGAGTAVRRYVPYLRRTLLRTSPKCRRRNGFRVVRYGEYVKWPALFYIWRTLPFFAVYSFSVFYVLSVLKRRKCP